MERKKGVEITTFADKSFGYKCTPEGITIKGGVFGIFVEGEKVQMEFNGVQLRFVVRPKEKSEGTIYLLFDHRYGMEETIQDIYEALQPFQLELLEV
jgi:hypothetical protein